MTQVIPRVYAELPTGERFIPGQTCAGPNCYGGCPMTEPACKAATWHYDGIAGTGWRFQFINGSGICPAVVLDPLGPVDVPLD